MQRLALEVEIKLFQGAKDFGIWLVLGVLIDQMYEVVSQLKRELLAVLRLLNW